MNVCLRVHIAYMWYSASSPSEKTLCPVLHTSTCNITGSHHPECFYKYIYIYTNTINLTFHCATFLHATIPYQMSGFYGIGWASKALYYFKKVVKYFQEAHIKDVSFCDRLCWVCRGTKYIYKKKSVSLEGIGTFVRQDSISLE